jgi:short-subunit dehydrogenase
MLGIDMMDKNSGNEGGAIINIASMSGECLLFCSD